MLFQDRRDAGQQLAKRLKTYQDETPVIIALPRGGVVVAEAVAKFFGVPMDVVISRRLAAPGYPEFSIGAIGEEGVRIIDSLAVRLLGVTEIDIFKIESAQRIEMQQRLELYRGSKNLTDVKGRTVILVDDGLASGMTAKAAINVLRKHVPRRLILAVPVSSPDRAAAILKWVDEFVCVATPPGFQLVNDWYANFDDCSEAEVLEILAAAKFNSVGVVGETMPNETAIISLSADRESEIQIGTSSGVIDATLELPAHPQGIVLLAHGAGSSRNSPRGKIVSEALFKAGFATLRIDLLTEEERTKELETLHLRFNVGLLTERVVAATKWLLSHPVTKNLRLSYFGASTGAAAMLAAAGKFPEQITAIISRGGRPDFVESLLPKVKAPTLFIVGGSDNPTLERNRQAFDLLGSAQKKLVVIDGANHLFEEAGNMEEVARLTLACLECKLFPTGFSIAF